MQAKFNCINELKWTQWDKCNQDPYGHAVVCFANEFAYRMEKLIINEFNLTQKQVDQCSQKADESLGKGNGITGFMYGCAIKILQECWKYGQDLVKLHNAKYNVENENPVNPAIMVINNEKC